MAGVQPTTRQDIKAFFRALISTTAYFAILAGLIWMAIGSWMATLFQAELEQNLQLCMTDKRRKVAPGVSL